MSAVLRPAAAEELAAIVRDAAPGATPLTVRGGNSKWDVGCRPARSGETRTVQLDALQGVVTYEPEELILIARAATPLATIERLLAEHGQHLAFEPVHWREGATVGGTIAVAWAGPRRFCAGSVRDGVLGVQFVDGRGRLVRSGGRVVKNVTGYDLWRGLAGSFGQLGLMTEVCLKLWPRPPSQTTLRCRPGSRDEARDLMLSLARRQEQITGLACDTDGLCVRVEGRAEALSPQVDALAREIAVQQVLHDDESTRLWARRREVDALRADGVLWRFVLPAARWVGLLGDLERAGATGWQVDWGGGLLWARLPNDEGGSERGDGHALAARHDAIAWRVASGPDDSNHDGMPPLDPGVARLNQTLRSACDPHRILNPGRTGH